MKQKSPFSRPGVIVALLIGAWLIRLFLCIPWTLFRLFVIGHGAHYNASLLWLLFRHILEVLL